MRADKLQIALAGRIVQKEVFTVIDSEGHTIHVERDVIIKWSTIEEILEKADIKYEGSSWGASVVASKTKSCLN